MEEHLILIINSTTKSWKNIDETTAWPWNEFKTLWCHADLKWEYIFQSDWWSHFCGINSPPQLPSCQTVAWMLASRDPQTPPESYWTPLLSSNCPQSIPVKQNKSQGSVCKSECSGARINSRFGLWNSFFRLIWLRPCLLLCLRCIRNLVFVRQKSKRSLFLMSFVI